MKIVFTGSKTAGHLKPLISIAKQLKEMGHETIFIGSDDSITKKYVEDMFDECYFIKIINVNRKKIYKNFKFIHHYFKSKKEIIQLIKQINPNFIFSSGGLISYLVIKAGVSQKIEYYIHEQNAVMGLSNRLAAKKAKEVFLTFPIKNTRGIVVGNPCVDLLDDIQINKEDETYNVLFLGGSLGSVAINHVVFEMKRYIKDSNITFTLVSATRKVSDSDEKIIVIEYTNDIATLIKKANVVVSRAGSGTICEVIKLNKPLILIPSINVSNNHQEKNAKYIEDIGCCKMILEKKMCKEYLFFNILELITNHEVKEAMIKNQKKVLSSNIGGKIIEYLL